MGLNRNEGKSFQISRKRKKSFQISWKWKKPLPLRLNDGNAGENSTIKSFVDFVEIKSFFSKCSDFSSNAKLYNMAGYTAIQSRTVGQEQ